MAARQLSLSSSIARLHGDERTVGSPLNAAELLAMRRTRLFGATGTVLMGIGALGVVGIGGTALGAALAGSIEHLVRFLKG